MQRRQKLPLVCVLSSSPVADRKAFLLTLFFLAKFTGYQYGGRPLGITFVKYLNSGAGHGDARDGGAEPPSGITQDQIM